jgi:hypothetical protein
MFETRNDEKAKGRKKRKWARDHGAPQGHRFAKFISIVCKPD